MGGTKRDVVVVYRSYYEAIHILPKADKLSVYEAVFEYGLNGVEPELSGTPAAIFMLIKPTLDTSIRRAESGRKGGSATSKPEAKAKQNASKPEAIKDKRQGIKDKEQETRDKDIDIRSKERAEQTPYAEIVELYHSVCTSYPKLRAVEGSRRKQIAARWRQHPNMDIFRELFEKAEASDFLKGGNDRNWSADFDWLLNATNMSKVLEGKYDDQNRTGAGTPAQRGQSAKHSSSPSYQLDKMERLGLEIPPIAASG